MPRRARAFITALTTCLATLVVQLTDAGALAEDAPSFAATAASRLPTVEQLRCSDPTCSKGLLIDPMVTGIEFRDEQIIGGGAFATAPGYRNKISGFWTDVPTRQSVSGAAGLSINLVGFTTVRRAKDAILADAAGEGVRLTRVSDAGLTGRWLGEYTAPDGTRLRFAYVVTASPEPTVVRGVCALWGTSRRNSSCSTINLLTITSDTALRQPAASPVPAPVNLPAGLLPVLATTLPGPSAWAADSPGADLLAATSDSTTTLVQYAPVGQPALAITQRTVTLPAGTDAATFVDSPCEPALPGTTCRSQSIPGGGTLRFTGLRESPRKVVLIQVRMSSGLRLTVVDCTRPRDFTALTAIQQRSCSELGTQLAQATIAG